MDKSAIAEDIRAQALARELLGGRPMKVRELVGFICVNSSPGISEEASKAAVIKLLKTGQIEQDPSGYLHLRP